MVLLGRKAALPLGRSSGRCPTARGGLLARRALRHVRVLTSSSSLGWINSTSLWMILSSLSHWKGKETVTALLTSNHTETSFRAWSATHNLHTHQCGVHMPAYAGHRLFAQHVSPGPERTGSDLTLERPDVHGEEAPHVS